MALMTRKQIRHLPVMEAGRAIGIISIRDVVRAVIAEKDFNLDALVKVIAGSEGRKSSEAPHRDSESASCDAFLPG